MNCFRLFSGRIEDTKKSFRNWLTFKRYLVSGYILRNHFIGHDQNYQIWSKQEEKGFSGFKAASNTFLGGNEIYYRKVVQRWPTIGANSLNKTCNIIYYNSPTMPTTWSSYLELRWRSVNLKREFCCLQIYQKAN